MILLLSNDRLLDSIITLPSLDTYIGMLPLRLGILVTFIRNFLTTINIVIFAAALFTYVVYITNEQRNIEEEIQQVGRGLSNKEISQKLFLSEGTVRNHLSHILAKLDLRDRTQLAIWAVQNGGHNG
ncbi:hypothetical protein FC36_GL000997 [Ligilactobacillus equi DSM 15833 = JCM 10991]|uniref:HTH luxR-type domain-containing protein n=1 Tax=Ligilactobacillus equi DSM 15833 = JCM 10991 TaxID=1423740 RepID=A0A0R1TQK3_9LACO|nr:hypothetical protein FC36_GL000997 [Ligilactobacillus equi DSM 15833 = JCM 10991]